MTPRLLGFSVALATLAADQASKLLLLFGFGFAEMLPGERVVVLPFFNLVMVWNRGISFGLIPAEGLWGTVALGLFALAAVAALGWWLWRAEKPFVAIPIGLVIGGALGNLVDRVVYGAVADFFHFHAFGYDWYVFNVADAAITVGVAALLYDAVFRGDGQTRRGER